MSTSEGVQKRNAFTAFAAFRIEGLEVSLNHAREIAVREELDAVGHYIEEAQGYLAQIRVLHEELSGGSRMANGERAIVYERRDRIRSQSRCRGIGHH